MKSRHPVGIGWVVWPGLLLLVTVVLRFTRDEIDLAHAVLMMMLIVLGGSAAGGRPLGFSLALTSFLAIDFFFQQPYDLFTIHKRLDALVLLAFLAAAGVATDLLARARQEATAARERASEVETLSRLGAATLRHADPEAALDALAELVRETIGASACSIWRAQVEGVLSVASRSVSTDNPPIDAELGRRAAAEATARGMAVTLPGVAEIVLALPLVADERVIGAMAVRGEPTIVLDDARRRFVAALSYYAALGLERARLMAEAAHSEALREANRAKDQVLASVSHDLRTPLTTIKVLAQGIESRGDPTAAPIVEQADRLARMVRDLLELSRLRAGNSTVAPELNTAEDLVGAALRQAQGILDGKSLVPDIDLESPVLVGTFDFVYTLRILGNLIENALHHTPPGGVVELRASRDGSELKFIVADRGAGVQAAERERIFDAFYRPSGATADAGHAGLGLSIAKTLAELQGGTLTYELREGGGSLFVLTLPAADVDEAAAEEIG